MPFDFGAGAPSSPLPADAPQLSFDRWGRSLLAED